MNNQPEALRLADTLDTLGFDFQTPRLAAAELRRLHEVNQELVEALKTSFTWIQKSPHGDNCYVSDHHETDPGNRCNCGKDSIENFLSEVMDKAERQA